MAICLLSSLLAFAAGFAFLLLCALKCSDEKWEKFKKTVEESRKALKD